MNILLSMVGTKSHIIEVLGVDKNPFFFYFYSPIWMCVISELLYKKILDKAILEINIFCFFLHIEITYLDKVNTHQAHLFF